MISLGLLFRTKPDPLNFEFETCIPSEVPKMECRGFSSIASNTLISLIFNLDLLSQKKLTKSQTFQNQVLIFVTRLAEEASFVHLGTSLGFCIVVILVCQWLAEE